MSICFYLVLCNSQNSYVTCLYNFYLCESKFALMGNIKILLIWRAVTELIIRKQRTGVVDILSVD